MTRFQTQLITILLLALFGFLYGEKALVGRFVIDRIDCEIDSDELKSAHGWDSEYEPYVKMWVQHPLVGKTASEILNLKEEKPAIFTYKYPLGLPQSDERWVYLGDPAFYFKNKIVIGVDDICGPDIFGISRSPLSSFKRNNLLKLRTWVSEMCELDVSKFSNTYFDSTASDEW